MLSASDLKPRIQSLLRPTTARLAKLGVTPNGVTLAALLGSVATGIVFAGAAQRPYLFLLLPMWLIVRTALTAIDGMLAREHGRTSNLGAMLNELGDIVSDVALFLPFGWIHPDSRPAVIVFTALAVMTE